MMLKFVRYGSKWYAATPIGEFQFGDFQGLNEWRNGRRIHYTGGDQQAAVDGQWLHHMTNPETYARAFTVALVPYYWMTN